MRLLLHTCCAPCAIYPLRQAKTDGFTTTGFFYNPNIQPHSEYNIRKKEVGLYFKSEKIGLLSKDYRPEDFFKNTRETFTRPSRCSACWNKRLSETVSLGKKEKFHAFTTTLLGSPYQNHEEIKGICESLSRENGVDFYYKDFRIGFKDAHNLAREKSIYCQNYCGCVFSMMEREEAKRARKNSG